MADHSFANISVQIDEGLYDSAAAEAQEAAALAQVIAAALRSEGQPDAELTLVLTDDATVQDLNRQYLGEDRPTDVLSFPAEGPTADSPTAPVEHFVSPPEAAAYLGDILIAVPFTRAQAAALGRAPADELRLLAVHGVLHLLGYDHAEPDEEAAMWARQDAILGG